MIKEDTYLWIEKIAKQTEEISNDEYNKLVKEYFRVDKTDWYYEDSNKLFSERRVWDQDKVSQFWTLIKKFTIKRKSKLFLSDKIGLNFEYFIFPCTETELESFNKGSYKGNNFWYFKYGEMVESSVSFYFATFLGKTEFNNIIFTKSVNFSSVKFHSRITFKKIIFKENVIFDDSIFIESAEFTNIDFENTSFKDCGFHSGVRFWKIKFLNKINFSNSILSARYEECHFFDNVTFNKNIFLSNHVHFYSIFEDNVKVLFQDCLQIKKFRSGKKYLAINALENDLNQFVDRSTLATRLISHYKTLKESNYELEKWKIENLLDNTNLEIEKLVNDYINNNFTDRNVDFLFHNVNFSKNVIFRRMNILSSKFSYTDISSVEFTGCFWGEENIIKFTHENIKNNNKTDIFLDFEEVYRQLKRNFDSLKNWELSGKFYVSEMEMRKKRLWENKRFLSWTIYKIYQTLGAYTNDFIKPLKLFLFQSFTLYPIIYFYFSYQEKINLDKNFTFDIYSLNTLFYNSFEKSISASLPLISTKLVYEGWWLKSSQIFISSLLLTFFILALRKTFKQ